MATPAFRGRCGQPTTDRGDVVVRARHPGYFTFDPTRPGVLLDAAGAVVSFSGELTKTDCFDAASGVLFIGPGDAPDPDRPPA